MRSAKSIKSDDSIWETLQVAGTYAAVLVHLYNVTKKARGSHGHDNASEKMPDTLEGWKGPCSWMFKWL